MSLRLFWRGRRGIGGSSGGAWQPAVRRVVTHNFLVEVLVDRPVQRVERFAVRRHVLVGTDHARLARRDVPLAALAVAFAARRTAIALRSMLARARATRPRRTAVAAPWFSRIPNATGKW